MVRPSDASTVAGMFRENVVRYQETPGRVSAWGSDTAVQAESAKPGRCQPERSPNSPPLLNGPRTGSLSVSPPSVPWMRQVTFGDAPVNVTAVRPRACLNALFAPPSSWCDMGRTSTASTWLPLPCKAAGMGRLTVAAQPCTVDWLDVGVALWLAAPGFGQQATSQVPAAADSTKAKSDIDKAKLSGSRPAEPPPVLQQLNSAIEQLTARISPAVVQVLVTGYGPLEENNRGQTALITREHAIGSGVIVDPDGYIMTNAHVVEGAQRIHVALAVPSVDFPDQIAPVGKQRIVEARLIGLHKETDLALIKIDQTGLPTLSLGNRRPVHQGQLVFALGSPEGLENSVTMGVVSSVARQADPSRPMVYIQTDAPINPGNSGGPLVDTDGYVVGINTFILSAAGGSEGLGFAIPARIVQFVYESLRK